MGTIINGRELAKEILSKIEGRNFPILTIIQFGSDPASSQFVTIKTNKAKSLGIQVELFQSDESDESSALAWTKTSIDTTSGGVIIQLPLPQGWNTESFTQMIPTHRDVDLLNPESYELWKQGRSEMTPPVVFAVQKSLESILGTGIRESPSDKHVAVIGYGQLVGKPVCDWLTRESIPYSLITLETDADERSQILDTADIIISGTGAPHSVTKRDIQNGSILIDCGTAESNGSILGDFDPDCADVCQAMTPVPGGIGPLTVAGLITNLSLL